MATDSIGEIIPQEWIDPSKAFGSLTVYNENHERFEHLFHGIRNSGSAGAKHIPVQIGDEKISYATMIKLFG